MVSIGISQKSILILQIEKTAADIGLGRHAPLTPLKGVEDAWHYKTLANPPSVHPDNAAGKWVTSVYRGLVPAKNIMRRDFAIGGAMVNSIWSLYILQS